MMLLWFTLLGIGIIVFFWLIGKMLEAFDEQDRKFYTELEERWYEERDKLIDGS